MKGLEILQWANLCGLLLEFLLEQEETERCGNEGLRAVGSAVRLRERRLDW